jgi:acyl-coenzyme A thioesterase PaaI-like protein
MSDPPVEFPAAFALEGGLLVPQPFTRGGWSPNTLNGRYLAGLVAWGAEQHADDDLQPARMTVDMFRPATMAPTRIETRVIRAGRRIKVVDTSVLVNDVEVCRGSTVFLRRTGEPQVETWSPPDWSVPGPDEVDPVAPHPEWSMPWEARNISAFGALTGPRRTWVRETRPFLEGEPLSPFMRAALAADMANGQVNAGPTGLGHINADLTMTLARLPQDEWIGLDARSRATADGVSVGTIDLYDVKGRIGQVTLIALADERNLSRHQPPGAA